MHQLCAPRVFAGGRWWTSSQVAAVARHWRSALAERSVPDTAPVAAILPTSHEGVALFMALAARPAPMILLSPTSSVWPAARPEFGGVPIVLPPAVASLAEEARALGFEPLVLPDGDPSGEGPEYLPQLAPSVVLFTSGSTGDAKPVVRQMGTKLAGGAVRARALGLGAGEGFIIGVPLTSGQGVTMMLTAIHLRGPLGLLSPMDHRAALVALAMPEFACWWATPHFADVLGRCTLTAPPVVPRVCLISSPISRVVFDAFVRRFGVPLRQVYSSTETGPIAGDTSSAAAVQHGCAGRLLPGVHLRIGERPGEPDPPGQSGRIWVKSPFLMDGYGFPPHLEPLGDEDGWWLTRDLGRVDEDGRLWLEGRVDHSIRTRDGRLVNLAAVEAKLRELPGVRAAAVVPMADAAGVTFGAVVEFTTQGPGYEPVLPLGDIPPWARPRRIVPVSALPALPNGKVDRRTCAALIDGAVLV